MLVRAALAMDEDSATLMERAAGGDEAAFATVVAEHQEAIARFCARFLGDEALAADLTQEVFISAWNDRARYRERGRLRTYLLRIARNRCLAAARKRSSRARLRNRWQLPERRESGEPSEARNIDRALGTLRPAYRELVVLRYLEELEISEIAEVTTLKVGTVKSRLSRALTALRKVLDD